MFLSGHSGFITITVDNVDRWLWIPDSLVSLGFRNDGSAYATPARLVLTQVAPYDDLPPQRLFPRYFN